MVLTREEQQHSTIHLTVLNHLVFHEIHLRSILFSALFFPSLILLFSAGLRSSIWYSVESQVRFNSTSSFPLLIIIGNQSTTFRIIRFNVLHVCFYLIYMRKIHFHRQHETSLLLFNINPVSFSHFPKTDAICISVLIEHNSRVRGPLMTIST